MNSRIWVIVASLVLGALAGGAAAYALSQARGPRYVLQQVATGPGVYRLNTRTGAIDLCGATPNDLTCAPVTTAQAERAGVIDSRITR